MKTKAFIVFIFMFPFFSNADLANWEKYQSCLAKLVPPKVKDLESCKESEEYCNKIFFRVLFSTIHFCKDAHFKEKSANWCRAEEDAD